VSALDLSVQAEILNLFGDLQKRLELACVFISHNLQVVRHVAHRVAVMYAGRIVELGPRDAIYDRAQHPYTRLLLSAVPRGSRRAREGAGGPDCQLLKEELLSLDLTAPLREVAPGHLVALSPAASSPAPHGVVSGAACLARPGGRAREGTDA
jgi:ABC-type microcin C transport system duplicated ATPase subunit YejF